MLKRRWLLIGLVVGVAALIDVVLLPQPRRGAPDWVDLLMFSVAPSQGSLLGLWAALGGKATPWRLVAGFAAAVACIWALGDSDLAFWACVLLVQMVAMGALLLVARLLGLELADDFRHDSAGESTAEGQWVQYSVRSLLSWTAACAVLMSTFHYLPKEPLGEFFQDAAIGAAIVVSSLAVAVGALWVTLGSRWPAGRIAGQGLAPVVGTIALWLVVGSRGGLWEFVAFCLFQAAYLVGSLWLVRVAGYRLVWRRRGRV